MAQTVKINDVVYQDVPSVSVPKNNGGGTASFVDTTDATLDNGNKMLNGVTAYGNGTKYTGSIQSKSAQTYTPTTSDQQINAGQYLSGAQTVKGDANLVAGNIKSGVSIFNVEGSLTTVTVSQDSTTKVLTIE